tara:strand:+ start:2359 stop:2622 length:264 start_codon:yes stop_codon:yes gene_type:complete
MPFDNGGWDAVIEASTVGDLPALQDLLSGRVVKAAKIVNAAGALARPTHPRPVCPLTTWPGDLAAAAQTVRSGLRSLGLARTATRRA